MTVLLLIVLVLLAAGLAWRQWRRASRMLYGLSLVLFLALGCGPIAAWLLDGLQSDYQAKPPIAWGQRNAIVLLGAGTEQAAGRIEPGIFSYARIVEAARRYHDCRKAAAQCKLIASGGDAAYHGDAEANVYRDPLVALGVDAADVLPEPGSMNTWQNAQFTSAVLRRYDADRVVLVSSGIHLKRSALYFAHFGVAATPVRADYLHARRSVVPLSYNFAVADFALHEYLGIVRYHVYNLLGWNPARTQPGQA
ncbi:hypothetical protein AZ16_0379 [Bordetella bronchiseptica B18-5 (C3)]|uniref:YdcF family protein n=1 Tax=Bordetella bronchiseptica TaxID=518 RepID=UPI00046111DC|nr:YdcF family protein [Bordetella bronchiseptica]KDB62839.1 hypothetical protein AZ16_0379 [Bordetella bronchiseptica B18-5 (C3)]KDC62963.1 hypothetical protein L511_0391 [Bordetella bronchiseptica MBORD595]KDD03344.1 hypothetical protein L521_2052 [Bordetella bronchiseptica MBORD698]KDD04959.1 hypothetical protein L520_4945 [Bordetella bronchiseptica MBORD681]KDD16796.1 hypothetical protein L523_0356 [Bordetella bronchiseptica MBORD731]